MVVLEATAAVPPADSWLRVTVDGRLPSLAGPAVSTKAQDYTIKGSAARSSHQRAPLPCRVQPGILQPDYPAGAGESRRLCRGDDRGNRRAAGEGSGEVGAEAARDLAARRVGAARSVGTRASRPEARQQLGGDDCPDARTATDGQTLVYTWLEFVEKWNQRAFTSFGDGHGVLGRWGADCSCPLGGGVAQRTQVIVDLRTSDFHAAPDVAPIDCRLGATADKIQSHGLDLAKALKPSGRPALDGGSRKGSPSSTHRSGVTGATWLFAASWI